MRPVTCEYEYLGGRWVFRTGSRRSAPRWENPSQSDEYLFGDLSTPVWNCVMTGYERGAPYKARMIRYFSSDPVVAHISVLDCASWGATGVTLTMARHLDPGQWWEFNVSNENPVERRIALYLPYQSEDLTSDIRFAAVCEKIGVRLSPAGQPIWKSEVGRLK